MAVYAISGVWKDGETITHYAFHDLTDNSMSLATKKSKPEAIALLDGTGNSAITVLWNYTQQVWKRGTDVHVAGTAPNKYLYTQHDGTVRNNLAHLINYGLVCIDFIIK